MKWKREPANSNPGYSTYYTKGDGRLYVARMKKVVGIWKLFVRHADGEPLKTIFGSQTLKEAKSFAEEYEELHT